MTRACGFLFAAVAVLVPGDCALAQVVAGMRDSLPGIDRASFDRVHTALVQAANVDSSPEGRHARVGSVILAELRRLATERTGVVRVLSQDVPLAHASFEVAAGGISVTAYSRTRVDRENVDVPLGTEVWPIVDPAGVRFPLASRVKNKRLVFGGRLGTRDVAPPQSVRDDVVIFLPPVRPDGSPDYQVWAYRALLNPYHASAAVLVAVRDIMPPGALWTRSVVGESNPGRAGPTSPRSTVPVAAISRIYASRLLDLPVDGALPGYTPGVKLSLTFEVTERPVEPRAQNVIAVIEGSDPELKAEFVVVSTRSMPPVRSDGNAFAVDGRGSELFGSAALVAIASALANPAERPKRSVVLLWSVAWADRAFGAEKFLQHADFPRDRIAAAVSLDVFGHGGVTHTGATEITAWGDSSRFPSFAEFSARWSSAVARSPGSAPSVRACRSDARSFAQAGMSSAAVQFTPLGDADTRLSSGEPVTVASLVAALARDAGNAPSMSRDTAQSGRASNGC